MLKDKLPFDNYYKYILTLLIPIAIQNLIAVAVTSADIIMLGKLNQEAMSGVSIANQFLYIYVIILFGISSGATVLNAQYWGKKDLRAISKVLGISIAVSILFGLIFAVAAIIFPENVMLLYTKDEELIRYGVEYLRIVGISYLIQPISLIYLSTVKSMEKVLISTITSALSLLINVVINYCLIFGMLGFSKMGVKGAAIGTFCARIFELVVVVIYSQKIKSEFKWHIKDIILINPYLFKDFIKYALPIIANEFLWSLAISMNAAIYGHLNTQAVAANSVAQVVRQLFMIFSFGLSVATAIELGKRIGEKNYKLARIEAKWLVQFSMKVATFMAVVLFFSRGFLIKSFDLSNEASRYLDLMLIIMCFYILAQTFSCMFIIGIFRAGGDSKCGLIIDVPTMWFGSLLLASIAGFIFKAPIELVIFFICIDEFIKVPLCYLRYKKDKWINDVTR